MIGAVASFAIFHPWLPPESWKAVGALSGSWTGGSANMLALKEALSVPDGLFAPVVVVDTFMAYGWMALLVFLSGFQDRFDRWNRAEELEDVSLNAPASAGRPYAAIVICVAVALFSILIGSRSPSLGSVVTKTTWTILLVTTISLGLAFTGRFAGTSDLPEKGGTVLLYVLLASLGARARLTSILDAPIFVAVGVVWMLIHGTILFAVGRWQRMPLFLLATASQACVGGVVSTPIVAAVYRPALAAVGLLMAISGNVVGTYLGFLTAHLCKWVGR